MNICEIEIGGKTYKLCLTRKSIKEMERLGFDLQEFAKKPFTYIDILMYGGFIKYQEELSLDDVSELIDTYRLEGGDVNEIMEFLSEEYASFMSAPTDTKLKKAKITRV